MLKPLDKPVYVTKPLLPALEEVYLHLQEVWKNGQVTNGGLKFCEFEKALQKYLKAKYVSVFCNGTLALQLACQALELTGEVITTPFTSPATSHALYWNNITPVFCDIDPYTLNINTNKIESLVTSKTTAILPVHVFGYPCDINHITEIAKKYNLRVIYDAAHCFGVEVNNIPIGNFGDISMLSFHATKVFHTFEGGALICQDSTIQKRFNLSRNLGRESNENVTIPGSNAKMNEFQAIIGLLNLNDIDNDIEKRRQLTNIYRKQLQDIPGLYFQQDIPGVKHNYSYFVIKVEKPAKLTRDELYEQLKKYNIFARKYFHPSLSQMDCYKNLSSSGLGNLPIVEKIVQQVLSLPLYGSLNEDNVCQICNIIRKLLVGIKSK